MPKKISIPALLLAIGFAFMAFYGLQEWNNGGPDKEMGSIAGPYKPIAVVELFTSQGCSSCPPADALLQKIKKMYPKRVFALSYHVDYWNYIGWEDPYSKSQFTTKQRFYNQKLGSKSNYTPQAIINGRQHFVGSSGSKMLDAIATHTKNGATNKIELHDLVRDEQQITFDFSILGDLEDRLVRAVLVLDERVTSVKRGENRNRALTNSNIVISETYLETEHGKGSGKIKIPELVSITEKLTLMLITETRNQDITGATKVTL